MRTTLTALTIAALSWGALPGVVHGQGGGEQESATVVGQVTLSASAAPVNGAFVVLLDRNGERLAGTLSDASGRYALRGVPGTDLRLRVERIGLGTSSSEPFTLTAGEVLTRNFTLEESAISLAGVEVAVSGSRRCSLDRNEASSTVRLWEEARKALEVAQWVDEVGYQYEVRNFTRHVDRNARTILSERTVRETLVGRAPVASLDPDSLAASGFVQRDAQGWAFYGPDAQALLSDAFLSTHCFETVRDSDRLGLAFEPSRDHRLPDIRGTLWFDEDGGLDRVEFQYTRLDDVMARLPGLDRSGGEVRFALLEEGAWVVQDWWIRMPLLGLPQGPSGTGRRGGTDVIGYREVGGQILSARRAQASYTVFDDRTGAVTGRVVQGESAGGLAGADVFLSGTGYGGRTSTDGSFVLDRVRPGRYRLVVRHPSLDSLGIAGLEETVSVAADEQASVQLAVPGREELLNERCSALGPVPRAGWEDRNRGEPIHLGGAVRPGDGTAGEGWPIRIRWGARRLGSTGRDVRTRWAGAEQRAGTGGAWAFCDLPPELELQLSWARRRPGEDGAEGVSWTAWETVGWTESGTSLWRLVEPGR